MRRRFLSLLASAALSGCGNPVGTASDDGQGRQLDLLLGSMSLDQKIVFVNGTAALRASGAVGPQRVAGAAGSTLAIPELAIPELVLADGPAGLRIAARRPGDESTYYATAFPIATALASTWDVALGERVGAAMGREVKEYGVDIILGPAMNIHRNPLTGRNFEYFTEDPFLNGHIAAALVNGIQSAGVGATLKHFAANNQETNRFLLDTIVSERALREIYLRGFEIAVELARPRAVMSAYNMINSVYASQSHDLLTKLLRDEWGFDGVVMTDWFAGNDAVAQMQAGNNLLMPGTEQQTTQLREQIGKQLDEATLDRNVRQILSAVLASPAYSGYQYSNSPDLEAHAAVAREAGADGIVLLKNDADTLPLDVTHSVVAAFGNASYDLISGGTGSGDVNEAYTVSLIQGLRAQGLAVDDELERMYAARIERSRAARPEPESIFEPRLLLPEMEVPDELIERKAREASVALVTIGRISGEFRDRKLEGDFTLSDRERSLLTAVAEAFHARDKRVAVILNIGNVVETASWRDRVDAIIVPWQGGQEAGHALADVITGRVTPSGKLATTFPLRYADVPSAASFPGEFLDAEPVTGWSRFSTGRVSEVVYSEGIYTGYRYYDTFDVEPAYEFGFGLSYTDFEYGDAVLSDEQFGGELTVSVDVTNSGSRPGREVVQLYLSAPGTSIDKPIRELKGFAKTSLLTPGETQTVNFQLSGRSLTSFDSDRSAWVAEAGDYRISIGASSRDSRSTAGFRLPGEIIEPSVRALPVRGTHRDVKPAL